MKCNKIAVISDLHANLHMLNAFLEYVEEEKIELIINLGDFVSEGPYPCEVLERVLQDKRFINIRGYDENKIVEGKKLKSNNVESNNVESNNVESNISESNILKSNVQEDNVGTLAWAREKIGTHGIEKIKRLPDIKSIEVGEIKILMMHLNGFAEISQRIAHSTNKIIRGDYYDYIFCGGGHLQQLTHAKEPFFNTNIIEPGALMKDESDRGHFVVLQTKNNKPQIIFESIICKEVYTHANEIDCERLPYLIEEINLKQDVNLHIYNKAINEASSNENEIFKREVIEGVLEMGFRESKYISIGCWASEENKIKELLFYLKCRRIKSCEKSQQKWYVGEITPEIKDFVRNEIKCFKDQIKWFEISFLEDIYSIKPICSIYHYGKECLINKMSGRELYNIEEKLKAHKISYEINA